MPHAHTTIALTGGSGFVGRTVLQHLLNQGYYVKLLSRQPAPAPGRIGNADDSRVEVIPGDLFDDEALDALLKETQTLIHLVGIIREIPRQNQTFDRIHHQAVTRLLDRARRNGLNRFIHMSALGTRADAPSDYHRTKHLGEQAVRNSGLNWTIFRPSLILGTDGELTQMVKSFWCDRLPPFVPYFGKGVLGLGGSGQIQPVAVDDVARCFVEAIDRPDAVGQIYELGGPQVMDWQALYRRIRGTLGKTRRKPVLAVPIWWAMLLTGFLRIPGLPFNRAQVIMARENSICEIDSIERAFGFKPRNIEEALTFEFPV